MEGGERLDKHWRHRTITIKINGENKKVEEELSKATPSIEDNLTEMKAFNRIEGEAARQSAVAKEAKEEDDFDWILPELEAEPKTTRQRPKAAITHKVVQRKSKGKKPTIIPTVALTVFIAILLGTSLGVFMLKMVTTESASEPADSPATEDSAIEVTSPVSPVSITLPTIEVSLVQGGAFSSLEAAKNEAATFASNGLPAKEMEINGSPLLFVGVANNLENAKAIGEQLNIETFSKDIQVPGAELSDINEAEKELLELSPSFYTLLTEMSTQATLYNDVPQALKESFEEQKSQWGKLQAPENEQIRSLKAELDGANTNLSSYIETKDKRILTTVQQHLLQFLEKYNKLS